MNPAYLGELIGTTFLTLFGTGVVANVLLKNSKGGNSGWIVITMGWAMAVFIAVFVSAEKSGAHLNPAITIALASIGKFSWDLVPGYILFQMLGAFLGAVLTWVTYSRHFDETEDAGLKLGVFSNAPQYRNTTQNLLTEMIGTMALTFGVLSIASPSASLGALDALPVALLVLGIGLSLGGPTGYAINPARDFGPRIAHAVLPIRGKGSNDWSYSWIPVVGPIVGALVAAFLWNALSN